MINKVALFLRNTVCRSICNLPVVSIAIHANLHGKLRSNKVWQVLRQVSCRQRYPNKFWTVLKPLEGEGFSRRTKSKFPVIQTIRVERNREDREVLMLSDRFYCLARRHVDFTIRRGILSRREKTCDKQREPVTWFIGWLRNWAPYGNAPYFQWSLVVLVDDALPERGH